MMNSNNFSSSNCNEILRRLQDLVSSNKELRNNLSDIDILQLSFGCEAEKNEESGDMYSRPIFWIGIYIAVASLLCVLAMAADVVHSLLKKKLWMPCRYFPLNAATITLIGVAMKLPVDLSSPMPGFMDQAAKFVSLAFISTMMVNFMPSLASMDNNTMVANVIGLSIFAITVCVNIFIQINTTVISSFEGMQTKYFVMDMDVVAYMYTTIILFLLLITISSSLAIPACKEILESRYQAKLKKVNDEHKQDIKDTVKRYWVMAETGSPQFMMANNPLYTAAGVVCSIVMLVNMSLGGTYLDAIRRLSPVMKPTQSPYKWSTLVIFTTQYIGVLVGSISPMLRWYSVFRFKWGKMNYFEHFRVENYWTKTLNEWKQRRVLVLSSSPISRRLIQNSKDKVLTLCIVLQIVVVFLCKLISLLPVVMDALLITPCVWCLRWLTTRCYTPPVTSTSDDIDPDLNNYVLKIDDELKIGENNLVYIFKSVNSYILKAEKKQNNNLLELIGKSTGFAGVEAFDTNQVQPLPPLEALNNWSLPIVTMTCIAAALPNIPNDDVEKLFRSVNEGLSYAHLVEESLNKENKYVKLQKVSMGLWLEVDSKFKWLGNSLAKDVFEGKTTIQTVEWFSERSKEIVPDYNVSTNQETVDNMDNRLIAANAMYRITQTILHRFQNNIKPVTESQLFSHLNVMVADIFCACFTNIPHVIRIKCNESVIEKRETSVKAAAKFLGKTTKIIEKLETLQVPSIDDDKMAYIDEWRKQSHP